MGAVYARDGGAPLRQLQAALAAAQAEAAAAEQGGGAARAGAAQAQGAVGGSSSSSHNHSVADVAALQAALGGVVWTHSMSRM